MWYRTSYLFVLANFLYLDHFCFDRKTIYLSALAPNPDSRPTREWRLESPAEKIINQYHDEIRG